MYGSCDMSLLLALPRRKVPLALPVANASPARGRRPGRARKRSLSTPYQLVCWIASYRTMETPSARDERAQLIEGALARRLVGPPADELGSVAEALAGDVVEAHLN